MAERPLNPDALDAEEAALWQRVVETVAPLPGRPVTPLLRPTRARVAAANMVVLPLPSVPVAASHGTGGTLDGSWDRRLARGLVQPDRSIDLHGLTLDLAYSAIDSALDAAIRGGERVILMVTGKARPGVRGGRGAIRAVVGDWLTASRHAGAVAAVRNAHPRHGGAGALYVILRRR